MKIKYKELDYMQRKILEREVKKIFFNLNNDFVNDLVPLISDDELIKLVDVYEDFDEIYNCLDLIIKRIKQTSNFYIKYLKNQK